MAANGKNRFLRALGGRYDFVRRIPADLRPRFGRAYIVRSLGSLRYPDAIRHARQFAAATDTLFHVVGQRHDLTGQQIAELLETYCARPTAGQGREPSGSVSCVLDIPAPASAVPVPDMKPDRIERHVKAKAKPKLPTFQEVFDLYSAERVRARAWGADMERLNSDTRALFADAIGNKPVTDYARSEVAEFVAALQWLPATRGKNPRFTGKRVAELVKMTKADSDIRLISPASIKKHSNNVSTFFGWCVSKGWITDNIARGVYRMPKRTIRRNQERDAWTPEQLRVLFTSPVYRGCKSAFYRSEPGTQVIRDARYWLPLLGAFHPVRLEEVAQLRLEDVQEEDGIAFMNIRGDDGDGKDGEPGRKVKTLAAWRRVPLHRIVIQLGFLDYVTDQRRAGGRMVFPELKPGGVAKRYGFTFTKWFVNYRKGLGLESVDFHAFRHAAITALVRAGIHPDIINQLDGHEIAGERGRYSKGASLIDLKKAIDMIAYSLTLPSIACFG